MSIDIFGRPLASGRGEGNKSSVRGPPGIGFKTTADDQYDIDNKRLCNIADPEHANDAVSLQSVQSILQQAVVVLEGAIKQAFEVSMRNTVVALESKLTTLMDQRFSSVWQEDQHTMDIMRRWNNGLIERLEVLEKSVDRLVG
jgi:hypothetical protein